MFKMKNPLIYILLGLCSIGSSFANSEQCCPQKKWQCGDIEVTGEFLLWQPRISGMSYASTNISTPTPLGISVPNDVQYQSVNFDYKPGFRVGASYAIPSSNWDIDLHWTRFETTGTDSIAATSTRLISTFWEQFGLVTATSASSSLKVDLQNVDLDVGKTISVFPCFTLRPFIGASYYKLNLTNNINYVGTNTGNPASSSIRLEDYSQGWGLNIGSDTTWKLPYGFSLYGKGAYSIFCSKSNNLIDQHTSIPAVPIDLRLKTLENSDGFNQMFDVACGLSWDYAFCVGSFPIDLSLFAGYEITYWPSQVELSKAQFSGSENSLIPLDSSGNVGFQGLTAGLTLNF